ncbi:MAG: hypothetical protein ACYTDY_09620 [Planctomycetota bacterium]|jgi:hypothetical protein
MRRGTTLLVMLAALAGLGAGEKAKPNGLLLENVNWTLVGATVLKLHASVPQIVKAAELNGPLPAREVARKLFDPLFTELITASRMTNPVVVARGVGSTLHAAGAPLAEHQRAAIEETARAYLSRDARRRKGYGEKTFELEKLVEEAKLRESFLTEVLAVLDEKQAKLLCPEQARGRIWLCPFSSAPLFSRRVRLVPFEGRNGLTEELLRRATARFSLTPSERHEARIVISRFLNAIPDCILEEKADDLDRRGLVRTDRARAWAGRTLALLAKLGKELELGKERMARARVFGDVLVPLPKARDG